MKLLRFYNPTMKTNLLLPLILSLLGSGLVIAQTTPPTVATEISSPSTAVEKRVEHIRVEDTDARIDEERIGGETQSITVQPKGSMPAYQVAPKTGERTWKILGF